MWEIAVFCALLSDVSETNPINTDEDVVRRQVDDLARQYRIEIYNRFRTQREVYDRWAAQGSEVLQRSLRLAPQATEQAELAAWFQAATTATRDSVTAPELPRPDAQDRTVYPPNAVAAEVIDAEDTKTLETAAEVTESSVVADTVPTDDESKAAAEPETSSLPWGAVGRTLFGIPASDE